MSRIHNKIFLRDLCKVNHFHWILSLLSMPPCLQRSLIPKRKRQCFNSTLFQIPILRVSKASKTETSSMSFLHPRLAQMLKLPLRSKRFHTMRLSNISFTTESLLDHILLQSTTRNITGFPKEKRTSFTTTSITEREKI